MLNGIFNTSHYFWNPWALPPFLGSLYFIFIGSLVFLKNPKGKLNRIFGLLCLFSLFWQSGVMMMFLSRPEFYPDFWKRFIGTGVVFLDWIFYLYAIYLTTPSKTQKIISRLLGIKSFIFAGLVLFSDLILTTLRMHRFGWYLAAGRLHPLFLLLFIVTLVMVMTTFIHHYRKAQERLKKQQLKFILMGFAVYCFACVDYVPMYLKISLYPFGDIFVISFISILGYAIIRYRAMEIDTVIHRTFLWLSTLLLLILPMGVLWGLGKERLFASGLPGVTALLSVTLLLFLGYYTRLKPRIDHFFRRRSYDYQNVLAEMPTRIGGSLDLWHLGQNILKELKDVLYVRNSLLFARTLENDFFREAGSSGYEKLESEGLARPLGKKLSADHALVLWLRENRRVLIKEQVEVDPQYRPVRETALNFFRENLLELLIPVTMQEKLTGFIGLGKKDNLKPYMDRDIGLLENIGRQIGITIDNALHHGDIVEKERIAEELRLGRQIQMSLLPQKSPQVLNLSVQGLMLPAREIGGDYYDFIPLAGGENYGIVIGDVAGKGVAAGLLMAMVKTAIHIFAYSDRSPRETVLHVNEILRKHMGGDKFMSLIYLIWQTSSSTLTYSSAGHENILVYRAQKNEVETIESGGMMLGLSHDPGSHIGEERIALSVSDKILLYTDGVTEAFSPSRERFGLKRLREAFLNRSAGSGLEIIKSIKDDIRAFINGNAQSDDITLIVLEAMKRE